jgi:hypothetical protein
MKDAFVLVVTSILLFACTGPATAQEIELSPEMKKWEPLIGTWSREGEFRGSPTGAWEKGSATVEIRSGGFFVEIRGTGERGGQELSWIEIIGYDPIQRTYISSVFFGDGGWGRVTSMDWSGTTLTVNATAVTADREVQVARVIWEHSSDFKSATATLERFTDGKWWTFLKIKQTKVK